MHEIGNKLFLVYIGGTAPGANIELHDIRFVVGKKMEDTYETLRRQWFGTQKGLHLDSFVHLHHVDGYRIHLASEQPEQRSSKQLYFVNFGGYFTNKLAEYHDFTLVVADSPGAAKQQARAKVSQAGLAGAELIHKDDLLAVDDCLCVDLVDNHFVTLELDGEQQTLVPDWKGYQPLP